MSKSKTTVIALAPDEVEQCAKLIGQHLPGWGQALRSLRESAGLSLSEASSAVHRKAPTWCSWEAEKTTPPPHIMPELLRGLNVPLEMISRALEMEIDADLDPRLYFKGDPVLIEYRFWLKKRGQLIQKFVRFADEGSAKHAEICVKLWEKNEAEVVSRQSKPRQIPESAAAQKVIGAAIQAGKESSAVDGAAGDPVSLDESAPI